LGLGVSMREDLDKKVELMVLSNQILTTLSQYIAVRVSGLGFAASSSVLEPNIHLSGLYSQFPCQIFFLVTIGPLKCLEGVFQKPHLWFCEPQLLAWPCCTQTNLWVHNQDSPSLSLGIHAKALMNDNMKTYCRDVRGKFDAARVLENRFSVRLCLIVDGHYFFSGSCL
jgi:hypothetical protein